MGRVRVNHLSRELKLAGDEPGLESGVHPDKPRRASGDEQHELHFAQPGCGLHDAGGQKSLLRRVLRVEDGEHHARVARAGGEVRGGGGGQGLDQVGLRERADDDHEGAG